MRFTQSQRKTTPVIYKHRFLTVPMCINGETRWLEYATWKEEWDELMQLYKPANWMSDYYARYAE
jgi:hypothetical protein